MSFEHNSVRGQREKRYEHATLNNSSTKLDYRPGCNSVVTFITRAIVTAGLHTAVLTRSLSHGEWNSPSFCPSWISIAHPTRHVWHHSHNSASATAKIVPFSQFSCVINSEIKFKENYRVEKENERNLFLLWIFILMLFSILL